MNDETKSDNESNASEEVEQSPDQELAATIGAELLDKKLVAEDKFDAVTTKISTGQMQAEDWRTMAALIIKSENDAAVAKPTNGESEQ